jgi:hypothetical protein
MNNPLREDSVSAAPRDMLQRRKGRRHLTKPLGSGVRSDDADVQLRPTSSLTCLPYVRHRSNPVASLSFESLHRLCIPAR